MEKSLKVVEQKTVLFYDDQVVAVRVKDGAVYVPVKPLCEMLGVSWSGQRRRINRDAVLAEEIRSVNVTFTEPGRTRQISTLCLPLDLISGFLFGITPARVKEEIREKLIRYQRECYRVLSEAFYEGRLTSEPTFSELLDTADPDIVQAYQIAQAVVRLARNQILMEARLAGRLDVQQMQLDDHDQRLELIEATLGDTERYISEKQATDINQAIRSIALVLSKKSGRNEYGACWGEFYRKFGVSKYRHLPAGRYDEAMKWLGNWYEDLTGETIF